MTIQSNFSMTRKYEDYVFLRSWYGCSTVPLFHSHESAGLGQMPKVSQAKRSFHWHLCPRRVFCYECWLFFAGVGVGPPICIWICSWISICIRKCSFGWVGSRCICGMEEATVRITGGDDCLRSLALAFGYYSFYFFDFLVLFRLLTTQLSGSTQ